MGFRDEDLEELFTAIGRDILVELDGKRVKTIKGRIKKEVVDSSPFESSAGVLVPVLSCKTSDLVGITNKHILTDRGERYRLGRDSHPMGAGFSRVSLTGA